MSRAAVEANFEGMMGKVIADVGPLAGKSFKMVLADSWEAGCQNWTPMMRDEFTKRRGYDPLPWLPCITGRVVGSLEESERFLWDFRKTIGDLIAENHYGTFQELCHKHGMLFTAEAPGIGMPTIADQLQCKARTDVPMGEFWIDGHNDSREPACAAHIGGQQIATAEAFTAVTKDAKWTKAPFDHKALGDLNFARGINRFVFHRYAMQPWKDRVPGMTMGPWGTNFERTNTWWEQAAPWMQYLSRSQALLQSGLFQADVLYFYGEGAPVSLTGREPKIPAGYDYDAIDAEALLKNLTVTDGRLTLPSGMSYRVLLLPPTDRMTLPVLRKIKELAQAGATILGGRPVKITEPHRIPREWIRKSRPSLPNFGAMRMKQPARAPSAKAAWSGENRSRNCSRNPARNPTLNPRAPRRSVSGFTGGRATATSILSRINRRFATRPLHIPRRGKDARALASGLRQDRSRSRF